MNERPKIKIRLTLVDNIFEVFGWAAIVIVWIFTIMRYTELPDTIPIHYNALGEVDGFGRKVSILTLPLVSSILYIGLSILIKFPQLFNFPTEITLENAERQYTIASRMIRYLKFIIVILFGLIDYITIQQSTGQAEGLGFWFLPFAITTIFIPIFYFLIKSVKSNS